MLLSGCRENKISRVAVNLTIFVYPYRQSNGAYCFAVVMMKVIRCLNIHEAEKYFRGVCLNKPWNVLDKLIKVSNKTQTYN